MTETPLHLLFILADPKKEATLTRHLCQAFQCRCRVLLSASSLEDDLSTGPEVIIADLQGGPMPASAVLERLGSLEAPAPLIVLADPDDEQEAAALMRQGAWDYVLSDRPGRLTPAIEKALRLRASEEERQKALDALRQTELRLRATLENTPHVAVQWYDEQGRVTYWNKASERIFGWSAEQALGKTLDHTTQTAESAAYFLETLRDIAGTGRAAGPEEYAFRRPDGTWGTCLSTTFEIPVRDGQRCFVCMDIDVSERKRADAELRLSEERFSAAFHLGPVAMSLSRRKDGIFIDVNDAWESLLGVSRDRIVGRTAADLGLGGWTSAKDRERFLEEVGSSGALHGHKLRLDRPDGQRFVAWGALREIDFNGEPHYLTVLHDITALEEAREDLEESELRFRQVTENIGEIFWLLDAESDSMIYVSPAFEKIWGRAPDEIEHASGGWADFVHPDDRDHLRRATNRMMQTGEYNVQYRVQRPDGDVRWVHDRAFPVRNAQGDIWRITGISTDITEHRRLEGQLHQAQKMEAIGQLAGGVAHDFNNLLAVIQIQASMLLIDQGSPEAVSEGLKEILDASERAGALTSQLLAFGRRSMSQARDLDLSEVIQNLARMLSRIMGENISLKVRTAKARLRVHADPGMMEQVLMNLAVNARDAMPDGGELVIGLDAMELRNPPVSHDPGSFVRLSVSDTGSGIDPEDLPHIFEPFFTTKDVGKGSGLGLATVFGIVEQHEGWLEVDSTPGAGTTFSMFLPALRHGKRSARQASQEGQVALTKGSEAILLVEDDESLRALTRSVLEKSGYRVIEVETATAALALGDALLSEIDLLLTDLMMPGGTTGRELGEQLGQRYPALKVIYTSGYGTELLGNDSEAVRRNFLQKPYRSASLVEMVRRCLDENP